MSVGNATGVSPEVDAQIISIFEWKWLAKSSAVCDEVLVVCGIFNSVFLFDQRAFE